MSSPNTEYLLEECRHFKWLWLKWRRLAMDELEFMNDYHHHVDSKWHEKSFEFDKRIGELYSIDTADFTSFKQELTDHDLTEEV